MIRIKQLYIELGKLGKLHTIAKKEFDDPLFIAWMVDMIFDGKEPPKRDHDKFPTVIQARQSPAFREFWKQYKEVKKALSNFQIVNMGVIPNVTRVKYQKKFKNLFYTEVPF